jgi:NAD(P)-dependent dehydrogenase (short-subunit alcohol dehydrogenase family)
MKEELKGKVAVVTGVAAKRGMGHAVALRMAAEGADVVLIDKYAAPQSHFTGDEGWKGLDSVVAEIEAKGRKALAIVADINNSKEVDDAMAKAMKKFNRIDMLVHCAAIRGPMTKQVIEHTEEEWRTVMDVNLTGTFLIAKSAAKSIIASGKGGKIVLVASLAAERGVPRSGAYCTSKWGVLGLMKTMALELAPHKINVNAINPGTFGTHLRDDLYVKQAKDEGITVDEARERHNKQLLEKIPLGRIGLTEDIANLAFFLVSEQSSYITGQGIDVCGGWGLTH